MRVLREGDEISKLKEEKAKSVDEVSEDEKRWKGPRI